MDTTPTTGSEQLQAVLSAFADIHHPDVQAFIGAFAPQSFAKKAFITHEGDVEHSLYFLLKGAVKVAIQKDGTERILDFWFPNSFFTAYSSLLTQTPSAVYIQAVLPTEVLAIKGYVVRHLYATSFIANTIGRTLTEILYRKKVQREIDLLTKSAAERYNDLLHEHPDIVHNIPIGQIASYLGIHPESLSRIRKG